MNMINAVTNRPYTGENVATLMGAGFEDPRFLTFRQARQIGRSVCKGEHGVTIKRVVLVEEFNSHTNKVEKKKTLKHFTVFNFSQTEESSGD